jgi:hypothetical protein
MDPDSKTRRKRFQFSLRTMLTVILSYTLLWGLTVSWGVATVRGQWRERILRVTPEAQLKESNGRLILTSSPDDPWRYYETTASFSAPCPFIVRQRWEQKVAPADYPKLNSSEVVFWCFGWTWRMSVYAPPHK